MKKILIICTSLILVLSSFCVAFGAAQLFMIDPSTGEILSEDGDTSNLTVVKLTSNCSYNKSLGCYVYSTGIGDGFNVNSTVYGGMLTTNAVSIEPMASAKITVYRDGELVEPSEYLNMNEPGSYIVRDNNNDTELLRFTIVNQITGAVSFYDVPTIFTVSTIHYNGERIITGGNYIDFSQEGSYEINYRCPDTNASYGLYLQIDHTAPELMIYGVADGVARSTVTFGETEAYSSLVIQKDGEYIARSEELKEAGDYVITYTDEAGNSSVYAFTMLIFLDGGAWMFVAMLLGIIVAGVAFMFYERKHLRTC